MYNTISKSTVHSTVKNYTVCTSTEEYKYMLHYWTVCIIQQSGVPYGTIHYDTTQYNIIKYNIIQNNTLHTSQYSTV